MAEAIIYDNGVERDEKINTYESGGKFVPDFARENLNYLADEDPCNYNRTSNQDKIEDITTAKYIFP